MNPEPTKLRRATRYHFGGVVELTELESGRTIVSMVRALSVYGCFVKTGHGFKLGAKMLVAMTHSGSQFSACGRVANQNDAGVGVEFIEMSLGDLQRLEACLAELARSEGAEDADHKGAP
jgi:hypothetical protein